MVSTSSNYSFALSSNVMLVANFLPSYTLTVSNFPANGGNVSGGGTFVQGKTNTVIATANPGYVLTNWTQGLSVASTSSNYTFVLNSNVSLVANFVTTPPQIEIFNGTNLITNSQSASVQISAASSRTRRGLSSLSP